MCVKLSIPGQRRFLSRVSRQTFYCPLERSAWALWRRLSRPTWCYIDIVIVDIVVSTIIVLDRACWKSSSHKSQDQLHLAHTPVLWSSLDEIDSISRWYCVCPTVKVALPLMRSPPKTKLLLLVHIQLDWLKNAKLYKVAQGGREVLRLKMIFSYFKAV